jgi:hypothetical protein
MSKLFKSLLKRKTVFAVVLALTIFGAVYGFAATLNVGANTLSAGNASVASCQVTGTPTGTYTVAYDPTAGTTAYKVGTVVVTGLDATNCLNKSVSVTLTGTNGTTILGSTMTGTVATSTLTLTPGTSIPAASVTGVSVAING